MTDEEVMYRAIERWRDGDKNGAILLVRNFFGDTADKTDAKMTDDFIDAATIDAHIAAQPKDWMSGEMTDKERLLAIAMKRIRAREWIESGIMADEILALATATANTEDCALAILNNLHQLGWELVRSK